uniref:Poly [ADP-ribose] polymerase n=1 Tax=Mastacembelus armatus TaxID=205130 RepID=A0A3Q3SM17_9TELE
VHFVCLFVSFSTAVFTCVLSGPESIQSAAVVLGNLQENMSRDLLLMLVENVSGVEESDYSLEIIWESNRAVVTFNKPAAFPFIFCPAAVVESICRKEDHVLRSTHVTVYPYLESLGTTLYGKERPTWKMPEPFTERLHPAVWKFLLMKKLLQSINDQMRPYFCSVDLDNPDVKLSPLPSFLRQKGLTVDKWMGTAQEAFRQQISQYSAFECPASAAAWKAAERDLQSVVKECAVLVLDASRGMLSVAGRANDIKQIRAPVENIVLKAMSQIERQTNSISEVTIWAPAMFYILKQDGLQSAASSISPDMSLSYNEGTQSLTITGLPAEVYKIKAWMLERNMRMSRKLLNVPPSLLDFLKTVDAMDMSQDLFTSQGISAIYSTDSKGVLLLGSSDSVLSDAENKMKMVLAVQTVDVEDQEVLKLDTWASLSRQLMDTYNSSKKKTVSVQIHPEQRDKVLVAGFMNPVREISRSLKEFVVNYSRVQETIRVKSCAVVQFIDREKSNAWTGIAKANSVTVQFDSERPRIFIHGAHLHVQKAKSCFQELISALCTDTLTVDKPGAKKYFMSQGRLLLSTIMMEFSCVVVLCPENQEEEEEDSYEEESGLCFCKVQTASGVLVSVSKADICGFGVDAVVNAANEDLQHIGGLALALLKAAGPQLQKISNDYIAVNGKLRPGDAIVTGACNLPCKYVIHAVGPRFTDSDKKTSVARLKLAVKESLKQAAKTNCSTIALPAISSGVFGFPVDLCAETIAEAVREYCDSPEGPGSLTEIHLVDNNDNTVRVLATAVNQQFSDLRPTMAVPQPAGGRGAAASGHNFSPALVGCRPGWMEQTTAEGLKIVLCQGNIQEQRTDVIVNTISETMNLNQGAVSKAILEAAGPALQSTVRSGAKTTVLQYGDVVVTSGFKLSCRKVFHAVCPFWDNGTGKELTSIIRFCLEEAEKLKMASLSFPPIGTGNLSFPKDLVSRVLLTEIHSFSRRKAPRHLKEVAIVVHPSSSQTVDVTSASASIGPVLSPSLGIHQMQMGALTLEVSSGDITKESSDVIVNSSNPDFTLKSGVSKAILDGAGSAVEEECSQIGPMLRSSPMIMTSAGKLPSKNILHVVGQNDPAKINEMVLRVLNVCEDNKFSSVSLPALGTGQGGASPSAVADAMVGAVVEFVRKKQPRFVRSVKILIFQTAMTTEFHRSMRSRQGQEVEEKSVFTKFKGKSIFWERPNSGTSGLEEEFESIVFQLYTTMCLVSPPQAVSQAKRKILDLIVAEQAKRTIRDQYISELSPDDVDQLQALQRELTISLRLDKGLGGQEPSIQLEGLTRDVFTAEAAVRDILRRVERLENLRSKALLLVGRVEWQFCHSSGVMFPFDMYANLQLEEALEKKQSVRIKINDEMYRADVMLRRAVSENRRNEVELLRKDLKDDAALPPHWEDMKGALLKLFPVAAGSKEYDEVKTELTKTSLTPNIISIERVQNATLWQNYQLMKKQMEVKNKHTNNEKLLFHGTGAGSIDLINTKGFNRGYAGTNGAMFGNGSYFAVDPAYSVGYANPDAKGHKRMYLTRVLAGDFTQGKAGMITPPSRGSGNAADLYDSVTDKTANPTMFVVFNDIQAYPEYLITFT